MTICVRCRHVRIEEPSKGIWYNYRCGAIELPMAVDPVTGKTMRYRGNDLGRVSFTDEFHPYCRDINEGECPHFLAR